MRSGEEEQGHREGSERGAPRPAAARLRRIGLAHCLGLAALGCGSVDEPPAVARNVLLIVVDTLRADRIGAYGYARPTSPAIDALAETGTRFERAYATAPWTMPSVASMLTGLQPTVHGVTRLDLRLADETRTLAEALVERGFQTSAVVSHHLIGTRHGFDQGFSHFDQSQSRSHDYLSTEGVTALAVEQLEALAAAKSPFFLFVHYFDPHYTYVSHPQYGWALAPAGRLQGGESMRWVRKLRPPPSEPEVAFLADAYDEEIRFTDAGIGDLLAALERVGIASSTVVALTADHGEELYERGWLGHTRHLYEELIRVPLVIRLPSGEGAGRVVKEPVSLTSLAATLLEAAGLPAGLLPGSAGSLLPRIGGRDVPVADSGIYAEVAYEKKVPRGGFKDRRSANMRTLVEARYKLVHDRHTDRYELYDLAADPGEQRDLAATRPAVVARMRDALDARTRELAAAGAQPASASQSLELSEEELRRLEGLGYVER